MLNIEIMNTHLHLDSGDNEELPGAVSSDGWKVVSSARRSSTRAPPHFRPRNSAAPPQHQHHQHHHHQHHSSSNPSLGRWAADGIYSTVRVLNGASMTRHRKHLDMLLGFPEERSPRRLIVGGTAANRFWNAVKDRPPMKTFFAEVRGEVQHDTVWRLEHGVVEACCPNISEVWLVVDPLDPHEDDFVQDCVAHAAMRLRGSRENEAAGAYILIVQHVPRREVWNMHDQIRNGALTVVQDIPCKTIQVPEPFEQNVVELMNNLQIRNVAP